MDTNGSETTSHTEKTRNSIWDSTTENPLDTFHKLWMEQVRIADERESERLKARAEARAKARAEAQRKQK